MKSFHIYYLLLCLVLMGCDRNDTIDGLENGSNLSFKVSVDRATATAIGGTVPDVNLSTSGFYLAGYYTYYDFNNSKEPQAPNIFNDLSIGLDAVPYVKINADGRYTLPISTRELKDSTYLSFFAWAQSNPLNGTSGIINSTKLGSDVGYPWLSIKVNNAPTQQCDIVVAKQMDHLNQTVVTAVDLDFKHILSKLTFNVKSSSNAKIEITKANVKYGASSVFSEGKYTFQNKDALGGFGELKTYHSGENAITSTMPTVPYDAADPVILGDLTFIPQTVTEGFMSLEISYIVYANDGLPGTTLTRSVAMKGLDMKPNNNYIYILDITAESITISKAMVGDWIENPIILDNTLLLLDGRDAPITLNGMRYWPDRSSLKNNGQILNASYVSHQPASKQYYFNKTQHSQNLSIKIPSLGTQTAMTIDVILKSSGYGFSVPFHFSSIEPTSNWDMAERSMFAHIGIGGVNTVHFDAGGNTTYTNAAGQKASRLEWKGVEFSTTDLAMYTFRFENGGMQSVSRNGSTDAKYFRQQVATKNMTLGNMYRNYIGDELEGAIKYIRVRKGIVPFEQTVNEIPTLKARFGF